jgi:hypothetical protein
MLFGGDGRGCVPVAASIIVPVALGFLQVLSIATANKSVLAQLVP